MLCVRRANLAMKFEYREPEPLRYEYRIVEISTGKILYTYKVPEGQTVTRIVVDGLPGPHRVERHLIELDDERS